MYSLSKLRRGLTYLRANPVIVGREANRLFYRRNAGRTHNPRGVDVSEADWDNLVILDACRYDLFAECHDLPGTLERRQSKGSHTVEFLSANFDGRSLRDTVYVTATPQLVRWREDVDVEFHDVVNVWESEGWDEEYGTVLPETMTRVALDTAERYPNKRLIVHYLQPHYPFIDAPELNEGSRFDEEGLDIWMQQMFGDRDESTDRLWDAYRANLERALPTVEELMTELTGRTVVTADHGNMVGERARPIPIREWGHPPGIYTEELVTVPWLVYENGPRREIVYQQGSATDTRRDGEVDDAVVEERLSQLGYLE